MKNNFEKSYQLLTSAPKFRINLGLERIDAIMNLLDNPQNKIKVIHIAGTNGKGSVCSILAQILKSSGYKTGLYTSPHLYSYTERLKINDVEISESLFSEYISDIEKLANNHSIDLTEFEILTAAAYKYFYDSQVDVAVMETGLGGRFDAVNIVEKPVLSIITSISIDHKDKLGDTIDKIAFEKAGIIKNNCPVVINKNNYGLCVIQKIASQKNSPLFLADKKFDISFQNGVNFAVLDNKKIPFSLWGLHQKQNLSLVFESVRVLNKFGFVIHFSSFEKALNSVVLPARFQYLPKTNTILDGSHNVDAAKFLRKNLDFYFPQYPKTWIYGSLSTKEYDKIVNILFEPGDEVFLYKFDNKLAVSEKNISQKITNFNEIFIKNFSKTANTLNFFERKRIIIITGSFYMIGDLFGYK